MGTVVPVATIVAVDTLDDLKKCGVLTDLNLVELKAKIVTSQSSISHSILFSIENLVCQRTVERLYLLPKYW